MWLPPQQDVGSGVRRLYEKRKVDRAGLDDITTTTTVPGLFLVPSYASLRGVLDDPPVDLDFCLRNASDASEADVDADIYDCPPTQDKLAVSALASAEEVVIPLQPSELDTAGVTDLMDLFTLVQESYNPDLRIAAMVVSRVTSNARYDVSMVNGLREAYPDLPVIAVPSSVRMREATTAHEPITTFEPDGKTAAALGRLADLWVKEPAE